MSQQAQTTQTTKGGSFNSELNNQINHTKTSVDDYSDTISKFEVAIHAAAQKGQQFIETSPEVIEKVFPGGLGTAKYAIYKNVRVYEYGTAEGLLKSEGITLDVKNGN